MSAVETLADVLCNYRQYRRPGSTKGPVHGGWKHLQHLDKSQFIEVANTVISTRSYENEKVAPSMFRMADDVVGLLRLNLDWQATMDVARYLMSSCCYAQIYELVREDEDDRWSGYRIVKKDKSLVLPDRPTNTQIGAPFPKWRNLYDGTGNKLIVSNASCPPEHRHKPVIPQENEFIPWLSAVHKIEDVGYRINERLLNLIIELDEPDKPDQQAKYRIVKKSYAGAENDWKALDKRFRELDIPTLRRGYRADNELRTQDYRTNRRRKRGEPKIRSDGYVLTEQEQRDYQSYKRDRDALISTIDAFRNRRNKFEKNIDQAKRLVGKTFYQRAYCDYRGRIYLPEFSYQGSDFCRAVIEFDQGHSVPPQAVRWIHAHTQNMKNGSGDWNKRVEMGEQEVAGHTDIWLHSKEHYKEWSTAEEPYCFLRGCLELADLASLAVKITTAQHPEMLEMPEAQGKRWVDNMLAHFEQIELSEEEGRAVFMSHLPIEMDQSNSAYQHIGGLMNDKKMMAWSNLTGDGYNDLYRMIGERLDNPELSSADPDGRQTRKIVKEVAKKWGYGASTYTLQDTLWELRNDNPDSQPYLSSLSFHDVQRLAEDIEDLLETECKSAHDLMNRVQEAVDKVRSNGNQEFVGWRTPMGFESYCREHRYDKNFQRKVWGGEKVGDIDVKIFKPKGISWQDMKDSAPPNLVHSLDATLIHGTLVFGRFWGEKEDGKVYVVCTEVKDEESAVQKGKDMIGYPVITVHDAFACHARVCDDLNQKLRDNIEAMYRDLEPLSGFLAQTEGGEFDPIQRGDDWIKTNKQAFG